MAPIVYILPAILCAVPLVMALRGRGIGAQMIGAGLAMTGLAAITAAAVVSGNDAAWSRALMGTGTGTPTDDGYRFVIGGRIVWLATVPLVYMAYGFAARALAQRGKLAETQSLSGMFWIAHLAVAALAALVLRFAAAAVAQDAEAVTAAATHLGLLGLILMAVVALSAVAIALVLLVAALRSGTSRSPR